MITSTPFDSQNQTEIVKFDLNQIYLLVGQLDWWLRPNICPAQCGVSCANRPFDTHVFMKPLIRDFSSYSSSALYGLFELVYSSAQTMSETMEEKYPDLASFEKDLAALQNLPGAVALVAEIDEKPVAYLIIKPRKQSRLRHTADLSMGVADSARGQGMGKLILQAGIERATALPELEIVYLMVRADNAPAIRLYEGMGFATMATLNRDTKVGTDYFDGILMRRFVDS